MARYEEASQTVRILNTLRILSMDHRNIPTTNAERELRDAVSIVGKDKKRDPGHPKDPPSCDGDLAAMVLKVVGENLMTEDKARAIEDWL